MKKSPKIEKKCLNCSSIFYVKPHRKDTAKYCSRRCLGLKSRVEVSANCEICNKHFTHISSRSNKAKYCSRPCYYKSVSIRSSEKYTPFKVEISCQCCSKKFFSYSYHNRKYCSTKCSHKREDFKSGYKQARAQMKKLGLIDQCNRCAFNAHKNILGVHHIDRNTDNNDFSNLEVLCPNCHSIEHKRHIMH
jgi:hypothetical protein